MERHKCSSERAEQIVNLLRNNPGVHMTLDMITDETEIDVDELAAKLEDLAGHNLVVREVGDDGLDLYRFPDEFQRGRQAPLF